MSIEEQISQLIDKYEGLDARRLKQFNEENTKKDFILPLFRRLGWDVSNSDEVAAEEKSSNGRVDYAFKIGGVSKFYLEAKPLREDLNQRPDWAKQVITYAENKGVTWAVLTNFKQLMVFNAEWDKPILERARFLNLTYQEYLPAFRKLWWLSRDSVEKGVLDEEARQVGALKPKLPVEKSLLDQLLRWRKELFNQIYQHNSDRGLELYQVDELIQQFINRLIFIRSTEDRGIEENRLRAALHRWRESEHKGELVESMRAIFHEFATLYDSDLFPVLDTWDSIFVESDTIEKIIEGSYERPTRLAGYDFAAIDPDVLGAVYEQYLGYVAQEAKKRATEQARLQGFEAPAFELEARRIKRKQQGIYYTPKFVVDYIVKETVGRFIKEHSYNDIFNIKILDPACGSGSFLIRAYDELLYYHARQQGKSPAELDHSERRTILLGNIFGVDLDRQAAEITRLSLLLRSLAKREILPSLADNIREGNSLISGTEEELKKYFGGNWRDRKPFNWEQRFPDIMKDGGFDVVIGNPPYGAEFDASDKDYIYSNFQTTEYQLDSYLLFIERAVTLLKDKGFLGFIVPNPWLTNIKVTKLRRYILNNCKIQEIIHYPVKVFGQSVVDTVVVITQKEQNHRERSHNKVKIKLYEKYPEPELVHTIPQSQWVKTGIFNIFVDASSLKLLRRIEQDTVNLRVVCDVVVGIKPYQVGKGQPKQTREIVESRRFDATHKKDDTYRRYIRGSDINRYCTQWDPSHWISYGQWLAEPRKSENFDSKEKIIIRQTGDSLIATLDQEQFLCLNNTHTINLKNTRYDLRYILALINSHLMNCYYQSLNPEKGEALAEVKATNVKQLPIRRIDFDNPKDKKIHDDLVALVDKMLELNKQLAPIRNTPSSERDELVSEIERADAEIDQKVYELYGLTEEERQVIESSVSKSSSRSRQAKG